MGEHLPSLLLLSILIAASAFFSGSETALFSLSRTQLARLGKDEGTRARTLLALLARPRLLLVTILVGNELVNVGVGVVVASLAGRVLAGYGLQSIWVSLAAVVVAFPILIIFGEVSPKSLAAIRNERWGKAAALPLSFFATLVTPLRYTLRALANGVIHLLGGRVPEQDPPVSEAAYRRLVDESRREGAICESEREMIHNVFRFGDTLVSEIMTPANKALCLPLHWPLSRIRAEVARHSFSRVPIVAGRPGRPVGVIFVKDLVAKASGLTGSARGGGPKRVSDLLRRAYWVPVRMRAARLLGEFQRLRLHMALVADEHGRFVGLVTMEDLLEELVGEIVDETDGPLSEGEMAPWTEPSCSRGMSNAKQSPLEQGFASQEVRQQPSEPDDLQQQVAPETEDWSAGTAEEQGAAPDRGTARGGKGHRP